MSNYREIYENISKLNFHSDTDKTVNECEKTQPDSPDFVSELKTLLNKYSQENGSNTPDWILRNYICDCLRAFNRGVKSREEWYGSNTQ